MILDRRGEPMIALPIAIAYILGSIPFGLIVSRIYGVRDLRAHGSGNIGATNVWRVIGAKAAAWVYLGDIGKGALAVLLAQWLAHHFRISNISVHLLLVLAALAAVVGHLWPLFARFRGGKGVNTALGAMFVLLPLETLAGCIIFSVVVAASRFMSLGSLAGTVGFFLIVALERYLAAIEIPEVYVYLAAALVVLIVVAHRRNIQRLIAGKERKFSFSSKSREAGS
ncbi:MAG: glycerol-3-phosphate 1-O-acyltransferase PlsY [Candidatus Zixiibacteriota bacterium]